MFLCLKFNKKTNFPNSTTHSSEQYQKYSAQSLINYHVKQMIVSEFQNLPISKLMLQTKEFRITKV